MSDFEFELSDNACSDDDDEYYNDNDNDTISCDFEYETDTETKSETNYVINMDDDIPSKVITKPKLKLKTTSHSFNSILNMEQETPEPKVAKKSNTTKTTNTPKETIPKETLPKETIPKETIPKETIPKKTLSKETIQENKLRQKEQCFEFNPETIDFYTKDLNFRKILIKNSPFTSDIQVICLLLKYKIITDYCCSNKKCKVKTLWLDKPIQLILHRKNNIQTDLTSFNLELICGNCYLSLYGLDIFKKKEKEIIFKCEVCQFPLVQFNNQRKKKGICLACEKRVTKVFTDKMHSDYHTNIQELYHDNPLFSEDNKTNYYYTDKYKASNSSSNYKPSSTSSKAPSSSSGKTDSKTASKTTSKPPVITLNMSIPNMDDLLDK
jgi:hypothetical protein